jgi:primosomal protein N' (replication factor Y)
MKKKFVEVALPLPIEKTFYYSVPSNLAQGLKKGMRVRVPFKNRQITGFVIKISKKSIISKVKPIVDVVDSEALIDKKMFKLAREISFTYLASLGEVLKSFLPSGLKKSNKSNVTLDDDTKKEALKRKVLPLEPSFLKLNEKLMKKIKTNIFSLNVIHGLSVMERKFLYLKLIGSILNKDKSCLLLVPDVSFVNSLEQFFKQYFGEGKVFSFYSRLKNKEKNLRWFRTKKANVLVIGTPQSIFLPFKQLGLIIVEEEQEPSYKQKTAPRVNIKEVAIQRAKLEKCPVILSSAALSLETFYSLKQDKKVQYYDLSSYQKKINVEVIDLNRQIAKPFFISKTVEYKISKCLETKQKIFLFLNRKGFSTYLHCQKCGYLKKCPHCHLPLVYYYSEKKLVCNFCRYQEEQINLCPQCQKTYLKFGGLGIEKIESELSRIFPQARIRILSAAQKNSHYFYQVLDEFEKNKIDMLISTQILAKRPHQAKAELVVLVLADIAFNLPDFRAGERLFILISQVKNLVKPGHDFIIQTFTPETPAIKYVAQNKTKAFYKEELKSRRHLNLPPYTHLIQLRILSERRKSAEKMALAIEEFLKNKLKGKKISRKITVSESSPCFYSKLRGRYRWHITMVSKDKKALCALAKEVKESFRVGRGVRLVFDVGSQDLL